MARRKKNMSIEELILEKETQIATLKQDLVSAQDELKSLNAQKDQKDLEEITRVMRELNISPEEVVNLIKEKSEN